MCFSPKTWWEWPKALGVKGVRQDAHTRNPQWYEAANSYPHSLCLNTDDNEDDDGVDDAEGDADGDDDNACADANGDDDNACVYANDNNDHACADSV